MYRKYIKRILDLFISLLAIFFSSPLLLAIAALVRVNLGKPVLFIQKRPGINETLIHVYKFRTMTDERDSNGVLLPDDQRLTKFGRMLRSTSLDELPELFSIIKGDMSLVGPRPQLVKDMVFMSPEQRRRHSIRPGLTGWAQINGRNAIRWEEKLRYDLEYLDHITFLSDMYILLLTIVKVIRRSGITQSGMGTAEDFGDYLLNTKAISEEEYIEKIKMAQERLTSK